MGQISKSTTPWDSHEQPWKKLYRCENILDRVQQSSAQPKGNLSFGCSVRYLQLCFRDMRCVRIRKKIRGTSNVAFLRQRDADHESKTFHVTHIYIHYRYLLKCASGKQSGKPEYAAFLKAFKSSRCAATSVEEMQSVSVLVNCYQARLARTLSCFPYGDCGNRS